MDNIVVLNDEHGNEIEFEYLDLIEHKCETKINQNVQKKTNLKTSLNNLEKIE